MASSGKCSDTLNKGFYQLWFNNRKNGYVHELKNDAVDIAKRNTAIVMKIANLSLDSV